MCATVEHGRQNVHVSHLLRHTLPGSDHRPRHDQWHPQRRVVEKDAMFLLAVFAEALAVIGRHDDERVR